MFYLEILQTVMHSVPEKGFILLNHSSITKHVLPGTVNTESIRYTPAVKSIVSIPLRQFSLLF